MTRHANLKTVSALTALALTAMLATSAWARGPVYQINDRNSSSVSVLTAESDVVAPLAAVTLRSTKGQAVSSLYREISQYNLRIGLSDQVLAEMGFAFGN